VAAVIAAQREQYQIPHTTACRALGVSRSWFYKYKDRPLTARAARRAALAAEVRRLFAAHRGTYGSPRITAGLRAAGWKVSENTVAAVMREQGLAARRKKKRRSTTRPGKGRWRAADLVKRNFPAQSPAKFLYDCPGTQLMSRSSRMAARGARCCRRKFS
jgi:putative transposase